jgi:hypothetical protein
VVPKRCNQIGVTVTGWKHPLRKALFGQKGGSMWFHSEIKHNHSKGYRLAPALNILLEALSTKSLPIAPTKFLSNPQTYKLKLYKPPKTSINAYKYAKISLR